MKTLDTRSIFIGLIVAVALAWLAYKGVRAMVPVTHPGPVPIGTVINGGPLKVDCGHSGDGTKWGSLELTDKVYPFGSGDQAWRARPDLGVSALGEHLLLWDVDVQTVPESDLNSEPNYTVRLSSGYEFTPPISEQAYVARRELPFSYPLTQHRDAARKAADKRGDTFCYLAQCFVSDVEKAKFLKAFDETAAAGGDLTISAVGPKGPVTVRYSLKDLGGVIGRLQACTR